LLFLIVLSNILGVVVDDDDANVGTPIVPTNDDSSSPGIRILRISPKMGDWYLVVVVSS
jgi:hypothetical protein